MRILHFSENRKVPSPSYDTPQNPNRAFAPYRTLPRIVSRSLSFKT